MPLAFVSPGIYVREIDQSLYTASLSDTAFGVIGTASWGPDSSDTNQPELITSLAGLTNKFGYPTGLKSGEKVPEHPAWYAMARYLRTGRRGYFCRVMASGTGVAASTTVPDVTVSSTTAVTLSARYKGSFGNNIKVRISDSTLHVRASQSSTSSSQPGYNTKKLRVYVTSPINSDKTELVETFDNLRMKGANNTISSLETDLGVKYWENALGLTGDEDENIVSNYVTVASTLNGNNTIIPEDTTTGTYVSLTSGDDGSIDDTTLIGAPSSGSNSATGLHIYDDNESFILSILAAPGVTDQDVVTELLDVCSTRGDCMALIDSPFGLTVDEVIRWHNGQLVSEPALHQDCYDLAWDPPTTILNTNLGALYYPWVQVNDDFTGDNVYLPPSAFAAEVYAFSDQVSEPWFAPAGENRGALNSVRKAERKLNQGDRDALYSGGNAVNPIATFQSTGIRIWGQRTLQRKPTALDRVNVRRLLLILRRLVANTCRYLVFEPNDPTMWRQFKNLVEPLLIGMKNRRAITDYRVIMDETTNTPDVIEQNMAIGKIFLKPTKTAEIIVVDFVLTAQGASFDEVVA